MQKITFPRLEDEPTQDNSEHLVMRQQDFQLIMSKAN